MKLFFQKIDTWATALGPILNHHWSVKPWFGSDTPISMTNCWVKN